MIDILAPANISDCGRYRYSLYRSLGMFGRPVCFIMLNPSTADDIDDDPTIRRCRGFGQAAAGKDMIIVNLFALRSADPRSLTGVSFDQAIGGPDNDDAIDTAALYCLANCGLVIAAWGNHGQWNDRGVVVRSRLRRLGVELFALQITGAGQPAHPLYLPASLNPQPWVT